MANAVNKQAAEEGCDASASRCGVSVMDSVVNKQVAEEGGLDGLPEELHTSYSEEEWNGLEEKYQAGRQARDPASEEAFEEERSRIEEDFNETPMTQYKASKEFSIPKNTLRYRLSENYKQKGRRGPETVLTCDEESQIVCWIREVQRKAFPVTTEALTLARRFPEAISKASANVSESDLRKWHAQVGKYARDHGLENIFEEPSRMLSGDAIDITAQKAEKGTQHYAGDWGLGGTETGRMDTAHFIGHIKKVLHPALVKRNVLFPVIYFVDGHKSHMSLAVVEACLKLQIVLISLYPNSTRIIQLADVGVFGPMNHYWKKEVTKFMDENGENAKITPVTFPEMQEAMKHAFKMKTVSESFKPCGLFPFNTNAVDYSQSDLPSAGTTSLECDTPKTPKRARKHINYKIKANPVKIKQENAELIETIEEKPLEDYEEVLLERVVTLDSNRCAVVDSDDD
ncbi:conserved hypothetical protein [Culex quinquefasciatus]|uniref:DDE-1 domain-containing protein n=1 Tax=Culex quinquefasciatus TaxID=7176 RepID=B0WAF1_CULQU|nr:conserved hypothetical protein [Culex quinquefasciatus]|eukprot:XP_001845685.1 conserved hypothetical protein [Culex quinquefasciatus]